MEFEFTATVESTPCHIRVYRNHPLVSETVNDRPHKHYFMEFHCVFAGEETIYLPREERSIRLLPGQILLLPVESYHGVQTPEGATVERLCFNFIADGGDSTLARLYRQIQNVMLFEDPAANELVRQCRNLRLQNQGPLADQRQGLLLLNAVLQLMSNLSQDEAAAQPRVSRSVRQRWIIQQYIEQHFNDNSGLEGLAEELYLSQRQTRKLVRQFMGEDYKCIIIRRRMELAEIYLRDPNKTLEEIAWQVGYRSYSGFQLCFKKYFGIAPSERREQLLG